MCISRESDKQGGQRLTFSVVFSRLFWTGSLWFFSLLAQEFLWVLFFDLNQEVSTFIFFWFVAMQVLGFVVVFFGTLSQADQIDFSTNRCDSFKQDD